MGDLVATSRLLRRQQLRPFIPIFMTYVDLWVANVFEYVAWQSLRANREVGVHCFVHKKVNTEVFDFRQ